MSDSYVVLLLSLIVFLPALATLVVAMMPGDSPEGPRFVTLAVTVFVFVLSVVVFLFPGRTQFDVAIGDMQNVFNIPWIPSFDIEYFMGMDGISLPLMILTGFVAALAMGASWSITKYVKGYCILFLLLLTGMLGVFLALDFFLFYVFWEVMLLPMYFLIGVWGGPRREYAAIKFFLYTLVGSVLMLVAILMLYFGGDLRAVAESEFASADSPIRWEKLRLGENSNAKVGRAATKASDDMNSRLAFLRIDEQSTRPLALIFDEMRLAETRVEYSPAEHKLVVQLAAEATASTVKRAIDSDEVARKLVRVKLIGDGGGKVNAEDDLTIAPYLGVYKPGSPRVHTFNLLALAAIGQHTDLYDVMILGKSIQFWAFLLLLIGFLIKVPSVPVHTWLPDAHVEAPTPISMILAGVLLKMGGYGIIRICYPICPRGGYELAYFVCLLGVVSMVYGAFAALAQKDFKRMVAYSSVSHMGYVVLGLGVWSAIAGTQYHADYWNMGVQGAMFQMIGHGISSPGMFFMVGVIYDRVHHRNLDEFGGLFGKMPIYTALAMGIFFAGLGLPGLCGFVGEVLVVLSVWSFDPTLAVLSAAVVVLTAAYILWAIQRVYLGPEYKGPHGEHITPSNFRENLIGGIILAFAIVCGVFPYQTILRYMDATVEQQVQDLADWTRRHDQVHVTAVARTTSESDIGSNSVGENEPAKLANRD